jgi:hypothetical protein
MTARALDVPVFDADNHLYETRDSLTKYRPDSAKRVIDYVEVRGRTTIVVRGQISEYIPNPTFDVVARPGAQEEYFRVGNPEGKSRREIFGEPMRAVPAFREPAARLELMNEQGLDRTLMFPTLASLVEERLRDDPRPEGLADPVSCVKELDGLPDETVRKIMGGNLGRLMHVDDTRAR